MIGINPRVRQQRLADFHVRRRIPIEAMRPRATRASAMLDVATMLLIAALVYFAGRGLLR